MKKDKMFFASPEKFVNGVIDFLRKVTIWAWWSSWSSDVDHLNKLLFPHPVKAPHEI